MNRLLIFSLLVLSVISTVPFNEVIEKLSVLEEYANQYYASSKSMSVNELILRYVRTGRYTGTEWSLVAGDTPDGFISFVSQKEAEEGTGVSSLRSYSDSDVQLPDGTPTDFVHMFAVMNGIDYSNSFTSDMVTLQGWAGDLAQLFQDIYSQTGTLDKLIAAARSKLGISGRFGPQDLVSDFDAVAFLKYRYENSGRPFAQLFLEYADSITHDKRVKDFVEKSFPNIQQTQDKMRTTIFNLYDQNTYVQIWECKQGIRQAGSILGIKTCYIAGSIASDKVDNHKAAAYAFADYLYEHLL